MLSPWLAGCAVIAAAASAHAATIRWNGASGGLWSVATNWSPNSVPGSGDDVVFDGTFKNTNMSIDTTVDVNSITFQGGFTRDISFAGTTSNTMRIRSGGITLNGTSSSSFEISSGTTTIDGSVSIVAGTLSGNGGALTVGGSVSQTGGSFTMNATTTLAVTGSFTENGGTFTASSGQVQIGTSLTVTSGTFRQSTGTVIVGTTLVVNGGTYTASSGTLQLGSDLTVSSGTFTGSSGLIKIPGNLGISGAGTFRASSGTTRIGGAFSNTASGGAGAYNDNNGNTLFNATTSQTHTFGGAAFKKVTFNDGLAAYWNLNENGSGGSFTTNTDNSGYANTGTATNVTRATASKPPLTFTNAAYGTFDGSTSNISATVANLPAANAAQSISAWVNITSVPILASSIVSLTGSSSAVKLGLSLLNLQVLRNDGTALVSALNPTTGAWHHVAYTWDGTTNRLYVDGVAVSSSGTAHDSGAVTGAFIGATSASADFFSGSLDEVRVYSRALAASEIAAMALGNMPGGGVATHTFADAYAATVGNNVADLVIASGIVTGTQPISIEGSWLNYGGRFTGTSTVTFTSSGGDTILSGGSSFTGVVMNGTGASANSLSDRLWIPNGALTLSNTTNLSLSTWTLHAGSVSVATGTTFNPSSGTLVIDSSDDQALSAALTSLYNLRLEDPAEAGVVGYWKLDEGAGPSFTRDWSGNSNHGTLSTSGATWTAACGSIAFDDAAAMSFDGAAGYVSLGTSSLPAANAAQTISAWINITTLPASAASVVSLTGASSAVKLGLSATNLRVLRNDGTALISTSAPSTGAWHHVAYTWDGANNNLYVDGTAVTSTSTAHDGAAVTAAFIGASSAAADFFNGKIDDVRVYNTTLTATQVARLAAGRYAGAGGYATVTLGADTTVSRVLNLDAGNLRTSTFALNASYGTTGPTISAGTTFEVGGAGAATAGIQTFSGGLSVLDGGTLTMATTGGTVRIASGKTLAIDGTFNASSTGATIQSVSGTYLFRVGSVANARPMLNITGLAVKNTTLDGMWINSNTTASTTFTRFDNIAFSNGTNTSTGTLLQIYATGLFLTSNGCTFDAGITATTKYTVKLTGNGYMGSPDTTQTRALFGGATCSTSFASCQASKSDDDGNSDGLPTNPASNGAVVQFVRAAVADTAGTVVGLPVTAFDWNNYAYYSTYFAYNAASGSNASIYVRNGSGIAQYSWTSPGADAIVGSPRYATSGTTHVLYVAMASGKIYQLVDTGSALTTTGAPWTTNPYDCSCAIVTPMVADASSLYWAGTQSGSNKLWTLGMTSEAQPMGSPLTLTPVVTTAAPAMWANAGTTYAFLGTVGHILQVDVTNQAVVADNSNPGSASVWGRIGLGTNGANRVLAGDDGGRFWAIDPASFSGTNKAWSYTVSGDSIKSSPLYNFSSNTVQFGTEAGKVVVLNSSGAALTGYPYTPGTSSDAIRAGVFYTYGILVVGTQTGKLFFIDRNNGTTGPTLLTQYFFGPTEVISGIGYDTNVDRYMIAVADPAVKDGRLYYFDRIVDPTSASP